MSSLATVPKIYHITHVDNLQSIIADGMLLSDAAVMARGGPARGIGMSTIKQRRLSLPVGCHPSTNVGDYVPFFFCPRSVMLYVIHCANHPDLTYRGGQDPIIHLEADLRKVVGWANSIKRRWAFSLSNAGARYAEFRASLEDLDQLNYDAIASTHFHLAEVKEGKQVEFLVHECFPWTLVERIGVISNGMKSRVEQMIGSAQYKPSVVVQQSWYF